MAKLTYSVREGDVTQVPSDVLLLRYAGYHSVPGGLVASALETAGVIKWEDICLESGRSRLVPTNGKLPQKHVLFIGTPPLHEFGYAEMHQFAYRCVEALAKANVPATKITTMLPRGSTGLDHGESLQNLINGFEAGCRDWPQVRIKQVEFVERNSRRAAFLTSLLAGDEDTRADDTIVSDESKEETIVSLTPQSEASPQTGASRTARPRAGQPQQAGRRKEHVFVAMPYSEQFEDIYELGIYPALRECGFICERLDRSDFTGDILERMKERIRTARFVLADLSEARPNVYLEVGYAWGQGVPVLFIARDGEKLHFDVAHHRCLFYTSIRQLKRELEQAARGLGS